MYVGRSNSQLDVKLSTCKAADTRMGKDDVLSRWFSVTSSGPRTGGYGALGRRGHEPPKWIVLSVASLFHK